MSNIKFDYGLESTLNVGQGETMKVDEIVDIYKETVSYATPASGTIRKCKNTNYFSLSLMYRHNDAEYTKWRYTTKHCNFNSDEKGLISRVTPLTPGFSSHEVLIDVTSQNGVYRAKLLLTELLPYKERQQVLEIWRDDEHIKSFEVSKIEAHGLICTDSFFKSMSWSKIDNQDKLVYCAHDSKPKPRSFFTHPDPEPPCSSKKIGLNPADIVTRHSRFTGNWGESTNETVHTCIGVIDVAHDCKINVIKGEFQTLTCPVLCDNNNKVACIGIDTGDRKFGLIYCNNRPSNVLLFTIDSATNLCVDNLFKIDDNLLAIHNLRVDNSGFKLLFAANQIYGAHHQPSHLYISEIPRSNYTANRPLSARRLCPDELFNLAYLGIPMNCFSEDDKHIYFTVEERMVNRLLKVNVETNAIDRIRPPTKACEIFDVNFGHILISGSSIEQRPTVYFASLKSIEHWFRTSDEKWIDKDITYEYDEISDGDDCVTLSAAYIRPVLNNDHDGKIVDRLPTIVMAHGGPHSTFMLGYSPALTFYNRLNFRMLLLNYRGSYGLDKRHNDSLLGYIGLHDVKDCIKLIQTLKDKYSLNMHKLAIQGGSHGGFLAAHLSCQNHIKFKCAIIRNPVIDLYSMYVTSDIPDWVTAESLNADEPEMHLNPDMIDILHTRSPSAKQLNIKVPTLLLLGKADKRVPMSQGLLWAAACRRNEIDCEVKMYDDKHDLFRLDVYSDATISSAIFLFKYLYRQVDPNSQDKAKPRDFP